MNADDVRVGDVYEGTRDGDVRRIVEGCVRSGGRIYWTKYIVDGPVHDAVWMRESDSRHNLCRTDYMTRGWWKTARLIRRNGEAVE